MLDAIRWDPALIQRYRRDEPRYGAYPAAEHFHSRVGAFALLHALRSCRQARRPLALHLGLAPARAQPSGVGAAYWQLLEREIDLVSRHLDPQQPVEQLHLNGGSGLDHDQLRRLMQHLRRRFNLDHHHSSDYAIELDPAQADWPTLGLLRELGFNRLSLKVQDLEPGVQQSLGQQLHLGQIRSLMEGARILHYRSLNIDLSYGLAGQTASGFARTVAAILALQPDRLSVFDAGPLPGPGVPDAGARQAMLQTCIEQVTTAGYRYIGLEHFALPDDDLAVAQENGQLQRNAQGYTHHGHCDLIGLGLSAVSQVGNLYAQNDADLARYGKRLHSGQLATLRGWRCDPDDLLRRVVIERLLCDYQLDLHAIEARFGLVFRQYFAKAWPALEQMHRDGLIELSEALIDVCPAGRLMVRALCQVFDGYGERTRGRGLAVGDTSTEE